MQAKQRVPICTIDGMTQYGTESEALAARLRPGDRVLYRGRKETVRKAWFYDGVIVDLESGVAIYPGLGDEFVIVPPGAGEGE